MALITLNTGDSGATAKTSLNANFLYLESLSTGGANLALSNLASVAINTSLLPGTDDGAALGSVSKEWSDVFLASGAVLNYANGNVVITHSSGILTIGTGEMRITTVGTNTASVVTVGGTQTLTNKTLTSPSISSPTGIVKGDVGLGNVDNTSDTTKNSATATLTNKRITKRVVTTTQSATPTINTDNTDIAYITGLAQAVTSFTTNLTGTPANGDTLILDITDNGTGRALTFGASFEASGTVSLPTTTVASTKLTIGFRWNVATTKWTCVAVV